MIYIGSSVDILYLDAFHKLGMTNRDLASMPSTLTGFTGGVITPVGVATLPVTLSDEPRIKTLMNARANALAWSASADVAGELPTIPSLCKLTVATVEMTTMVAHPDCREEILRYKKYATLPANKATARRIKRTEAWYAIVNGCLHRRAFSQPLLRCLSRFEADTVLVKVHEGMCSEHIGGRTLAFKILRL
ncbi:hypothetical protein BHE74_00046062 [Ensete ventricosum]|nr:hypothetical protein BHE74_00046062 [Ensete ventricosum]